MHILLGNTPRSTSSLSIGPRSRRAAKKRNGLPAGIARPRNYRENCKSYISSGG